MLRHCHRLCINQYVTILSPVYNTYYIMILLSASSLLIWYDTVIRFIVICYDSVIHFIITNMLRYRHWLCID